MKPLRIILVVFVFLFGICQFAVAQDTPKITEERKMVAPRMDIDAQIREMQRAISDLQSAMDHMNERVDRVEHDLREIKSNFA